MGSGASTNGSNGGAGLSVIPVPMHRENNGNLSSGKEDCLVKLMVSCPCRYGLIFSCIFP